jgi:hypothetical protein
MVKHIEVKMIQNLGRVTITVGPRPAGGTAGAAVELVFEAGTST